MTDILISSFLLSLVLLGIHSYFGMEIIRRGIIFTDLAIGQMAALGAATAIFLFEDRFIYPISLAFALVGALLSALAARKEKHLEAFIGLLYAFGISAVFILLSKSPHGMEEFNSLLAADILLIPVSEILRTAVLYLFLGFVLLLIQKKTHGNIKELLFFTVFAFTVTSSVRLAGVFVVFALLIGPAFIAIKIPKKNPLIYAWGIGLVINLLAILVSYRFDFPTGYTIVLLHSFIAILFSLFGKRMDRKSEL